MVFREQAQFKIGKQSENTLFSFHILATFTTITVVEIYTSISKKVLASSSKIVLDVSDLN